MECNDCERITFTISRVKSKNVEKGTFGTHTVDDYPRTNEVPIIKQQWYFNTGDFQKHLFCQNNMINLEKLITVFLFRQENSAGNRKADKKHPFSVNWVLESTTLSFKQIFLLVYMGGYASEFYAMSESSLGDKLRSNYLDLMFLVPALKGSNIRKFTAHIKI